MTEAVKYFKLVKTSQETSQETSQAGKLGHRWVFRGDRQRKGYGEISKMAIHNIRRIRMPAHMEKYNTVEEITALYDQTRDLIVSKWRRGQDFSEEHKFFKQVTKRYCEIVLGK